jgi:hypothetical protein
MITLALFSRVFKAAISTLNRYAIPFKARIDADGGFFEGQDCLVSKLNNLL